MERNIHDLLQEWLWKKLLGTNNCASYDGSVDLDVLNIIEIISNSEDSIFYTDIAEKLSLKLEYVELVQFMLCGADYAEYGCSPRGCWITNKGKRFYRRMKPYHDWLKND